MDKKEIIKKTLDRIRKNTNFAYNRAKDRNIKNPTTHAKHKEIINKRKTLSNYRFMQYLRDISKADKS